MITATYYLHCVKVQGIFQQQNTTDFSSVVFCCKGYLFGCYYFTANFARRSFVFVFMHIRYPIIRVSLQPGSFFLKLKLILKLIEQKEFAFNGLLSRRFGMTPFFDQPFYQLLYFHNDDHCDCKGQSCDVFAN